MQLTTSAFSIILSNLVPSVVAFMGRFPSSGQTCFLVCAMPDWLSVDLDLCVMGLRNND